MSLRSTVQQVIEKVLTWTGFRVESNWLIYQLQQKWQQEKSSTLATAYNSVAAVNVTMQDNAEVLAPLLAQNTSGNAYGNLTQWDFTEGRRIWLGTYVDIDDEGDIDIPIYDDGWSSTPEGYTRYAVPSVITDKAGNSHLVYPCWQWLGAAGSEKMQFAPKTIEYHHNCMYLGTGLDGHEWASILTQTAAAISGTETTITVTSATGLLVGQFIRFKNEDGDVVGGGYIKAISGTSVTIAVVLGATSVTEIEAYKEMLG